MKKIIKKIRNRIHRLTLEIQYKDVLDANKKLRNKYSGQRCFIIGNGPSIKDLDLIKLSKENTFVVNTFWNHPDFNRIAPKYYAIVDEDIFSKSDESDNYFLKDLLSHGKNPPSSTKFFFHAAGKNFIEKNKLFRNNSVHYLAYDGFLDDDLNFNIEIDGIIPYTKNVIISALIIAIYAGFKEIFLLGVEHDFLAYPAYKHYENFKHFYPTNYTQSNPKDVEYYKMAVMPYEKHIASALKLFRNYRLLKEKVAKTKPEVKICNATPNSFLDVFPMVNFEDIKF